MVSFNPKGRFSRPIFQYGLLALMTLILGVSLPQLPFWDHSPVPHSGKEVLVRQFLSHASELAIRYQQNQTISSVSTQN
ncbi:hypothetical protein [Planktothrix sp. FACHB-1365]|uniref:hypothetical protein n=1 Tax=Planktothrix sp. FACHB-1365 TaxID=2692855 RepID=UPI001686E2E5|nr:hypothetical protein [Planktothrix sp. FACHB-1365]